MWRKPFAIPFFTFLLVFALVGCRVSTSVAVSTADPAEETVPAEDTSTPVANPEPSPTEMSLPEPTATFTIAAPTVELPTHYDACGLYYSKDNLPTDYKEF